MKLTNEQILLLAKGLNIGNIKKMPGTFGTLLGIPLFFLISFLNTKSTLAIQALLIIGFILFSIWICDQAVTILNQEDPGCVVIDEVAGFLVAMMGMDMSVMSVVLAFLAFRFFDILKPGPVGFLERNVPGGAGVVCDDIAAGILANISVTLILGILSIIT